MSDNLINRSLNEAQISTSINVTGGDGVQSNINDINEIGNVR